MSRNLENSKSIPDSNKDVTISTPENSTKHLQECRLWIGNLDPRLREFKLLKMVEKFGSLAEFDFLYHRSGPQIGQPRGYAFVTFKNLEDANKCQRTLDGVQVMGKKMAVKWAHAVDEAKYISRSIVAPPPILSITKESQTGANDRMSKKSKIASLEAQLQQMEDTSGGGMSFTPDVGAASSRPTSVIYNYIEPKPKTTYHQYQRKPSSSSNRHNTPYTRHRR